MTISPLPPGDGPLYERLAAHISTEIASGALSPGSRLPTQRDLARTLGTTVGTVGRAYDLLQQRGYVNGTVGRGTFVSGTEPAPTIGVENNPALASGPAWSGIEKKLTEIIDHLAAIRSLLEGKRG